MMEKVNKQDLDIDDIKTMHDKAYRANQVTREQAADDLVFYWVTQWDDQLLSDSQLQYRGQFDIIRKAGRQILSDLKQNPVQPDFKPKNESRTDDAELMDGLYRADDRRLSSQEAYDYACQEQVVCGVGAWELSNEYEDNLLDNTKQKICRRFIAEANNTVFWDPNAKRLDKSDARYCTVIEAFSWDGYKVFVEELTGEQPTDRQMDSFANPEESYAFPWVSGENDKKIYVGKFYYRRKVKAKVFTLVDPLGEELMVKEENINDVMDELVAGGYDVSGEKVVDDWEITRYIVSGADIIKEEKVPGKFIPVVPVYGERSIIEGEEYYEGFVRLAKDPQRLRNFQLSYLADIASRSPRPKPMFYPEQIEGFQHMYEENGADSNYPYYLLRSKDANGNPLPNTPVGEMPQAKVPDALIQSIGLSREAVEDVANPGTPQDIADPDLSGKAVNALQSRLDQQSYHFQHNFKFAKRRDAEIYASMAAVIYDTPRTVSIQTPDGQERKVQLMETVIDRQTGEPVVINDLTNLELDVYADIGKAYETQKQQTREELASMAAAMDPNDPLRKILTMKTLELMDGVQLDDVRQHIRKQLLLAGIKEPETEEDLMILQKAAGQQQQPDAALILAMAEDKKAAADILRERREMLKDKADIINKRSSIQIDAYNALTNREKVSVDAREKGLNIENKTLEAQNKIIKNQRDQYELEQQQFEDDLKGTSTGELINMLSSSGG